MAQKKARQPEQTGEKENNVKAVITMSLAICILLGLYIASLLVRAIWSKELNAILMGLLVWGLADLILKNLNADLLPVVAVRSGFYWASAVGLLVGLIVKYGTKARQR